jgi:hypothetical protein
MRIGLRLLVILICILGVSACQSEGESGGGAQTGTDAQGTAQKFLDALLAGNFEEAKAMAVGEEAELVGERVDAFAALIEKYELQEAKIASTRAWTDGTGTEESDKRVEITYQYREKGTGDRWRIGSINVRTLLSENHTWGIANLQLIRPTS